MFEGFYWWYVVGCIIVGVISREIYLFLVKKYMRKHQITKKSWWMKF